MESRGGDVVEWVECVLVKEERLIGRSDDEDIVAA